MAADTIAFMQLLEGDLFADFPTLRFIIPHGGGAVPYHWGRYRGLADMLKKPSLDTHLMNNIFFDTPLDVSGPDKAHQTRLARESAAMTALPHRTLGGFDVSAIGLGCMNLSHAYDVPPSEADAVRLLNHALDAGITLLDTAALYGGGANESLIGRSVMSRRSEFVLASKCVLEVVDGKRSLDGRPGAIARALDRALLRLGTDHIDLYYLHRLDRSVPIEDSVGALVRAKEQGKIGAIGLSEMSASTVRLAHGVHPIAAVQTEYSPWVRNVEVAVRSTCEELGIGLVAFSPIGRGFLAGAIRTANFAPGDIRATMPRFVEPNFSANLALLDRFCSLAHQSGLTPAQLSLSWVLAQALFIVPIAGTRSIAHLDEDLKAAYIHLACEVVAAVDAIFAPGSVAGPRYSDQAQSQIDTELLPEESHDYGV